MYLTDAGLHQAVVTASSVSGGSITNAGLGLKPFKQMNPEDLWDYAAHLVPRLAGNVKAFLVAATRRDGGAHIKKGWNAPPLAPEDTGNIVDVDFSSLIPFEAGYLEAVRDHLGLMPDSMRSVLRRLTRGRSG